MRGTCCGSESNFSIQVETIALFVPGSVIPLKCRDGPSCHEEKSCRKVKGGGLSKLSHQNMQSHSYLLKLAANFFLIHMLF